MANLANPVAIIPLAIKLGSRPPPLQYYTVVLLDILYNGQSVGLDSSNYNSGNSGTIIDSGTTGFFPP